MLKKEEVPILHERCFEVPIFPKLLSPDIKLDENLAKIVFPTATEEWYSDLIEYSKNLEDKNTKKWIDSVFLKKKPKIKKEFNDQFLDTLYWKDQVFTLKNGFASSLSISRDAGGTLYFNSDDMFSPKFISFDSSAGYIRFSKEKALEFKIGDVIKLPNNIEGVKVYIYNMHNVDHYPGALFLRNWAILYLNKAMKQTLT